MDTLTGFGLLLVDDHPLFRDSFAMAIRQLAPDTDVVAVASLPQARQCLAAHPERFDLVLVDYKLPGSNGLICATQLRHEQPAVAFGLISGEDDPRLPQLARDAGLVAYLPKSLEMDSLLAALQALARGATVYATPDAPPPGTREPDFGLTPRQMDVLRLLASGASNKAIAQSMGISPTTVKHHLEAIFEKMGVANRLQAVMLARAALH